MPALLSDGVLQLTDQVKLTHWNVHGAHFTAYHELFDAIYAPPSRSGQTRPPRGPP